MKKIFTFLLAIGILGIFTTVSTSCTREYICKCVLSYEGAPGLPEPDTREYTIQDTHKNAEKICKGNSKEYQEGTIITHEDCDLW